MIAPEKKRIEFGEPALDCGEACPALSRLHLRNGWRLVAAE
jgi:hypothetical protein